MDKNEPNKSTRKVTLGTGMTKLEFSLDDEQGSCQTSDYHRHWHFPNPYGPSQYPNVPIVTTRYVLQIEDWERFLMGKLANAGLPTHQKQVIWSGKNQWSELPEEYHQLNSQLGNRGLTDDEWNTLIEQIGECNRQAIEKHGSDIEYKSTSDATKEDKFLDSDSPEGYAARLLKILSKVSNENLEEIMSRKPHPADPAQENSIHQRLSEIFDAGVEFGMLYAEAHAKEKYEKNHQSGKKIRASWWPQQAIARTKVAGSKKVSRTFRGSPKTISR